MQVNLEAVDSVGRVVASDTRDPRFESNHWQIIFTINCIQKTKIKDLITASRKITEQKNTERKNCSRKDHIKFNVDPKS